MIGEIQLPQTAMAMGEMDSDRRRAISPRAFMVIDDKGEKNMIKALAWQRRKGGEKKK